MTTSREHEIAATLAGLGIAALGITAFSLVFRDRRGTPVAFAIRSFRERPILRLVDGDRAALARHFPRRSGRGFNEEAAAALLIEACVKAGHLFDDQLTAFGFRVRHRLIGGAWFIDPARGRERRSPPVNQPSQ